MRDVHPQYYQQRVKNTRTKGNKKYLGCNGLYIRSYKDKLGKISGEATYTEKFT